MTSRLPQRTRFPAGALCDDSGSWAHKKKSPPVLFEVAPPAPPLPTAPTRCVLYLTDSDGGKTEEGEARGAASGINRLFTPAVCLTLSRSAILYLPPLSCYHIRTAGFFFSFRQALLSPSFLSCWIFIFLYKKRKKINNKKKQQKRLDISFGPSHQIPIEWNQGRDLISIESPF